MGLGLVAVAVGLLAGRLGFAEYVVGGVRVGQRGFVVGFLVADWGPVRLAGFGRRNRVRLLLG